MPEYIAKIPIAVQISHVGREITHGLLSLTRQARHHGGPETLLERLNRSDRVVPFYRSEDDVTLLVSRLDIEWVLPGNGVELELVCPRTYHVTREERVRVRFRSGAELEGYIQMELPDDVNRTSDFLNGPGDFFPLFTEKGITLVNKAQVVDTIVFENSPMPVTTLGGDASESNGS